MEITRTRIGSPEYLQRRRQWYQNQSPEQKEKRKRKDQERYQNQSPEQKEKRKRKDQEQKRQLQLDLANSNSFVNVATIPATMYRIIRILLASPILELLKNLL